MEARKVVYNIDYVHILTFNEHYRSIIEPYFAYKDLGYNIEFENTINEAIRLTFKSEGFVIYLRKDTFVLLYEGDVKEIKKSSPITEIYFDIYEKLKKVPGFHKTTRHKMEIDWVRIEEESLVEKELNGNTYLKNPFGKLREFNCILEFGEGNPKYKLQFGNYSESDIKKFELSPLKTEFNKDLIGKVGFMCRTTIDEEITNSSYSKFRNLLTEGEKILNQYIA